MHTVDGSFDIDNLIKLPVIKGGLDNVTAQASLAMLNGVPASVKGIPGGVLTLMSNGKVDQYQLSSLSTEVVFIDGPKYVPYETTSTYHITNYNRDTNYSVTPIAGNATLSHDLITYTSPDSTHSGLAGFMLNGKRYLVMVGPSQVVKPSVVDPVHNSNIIRSIYTFHSSEYATIGYTTTHATSSWELASDINFSNIQNQSINSSSNKTSWTINNLTDGTYYVRVRYTDDHNHSSDWSDPISFTVTLKSIPILLSETLIGNNYFGYSSSVSDDFNTLVISSCNTSDPKVRIYEKAGAIFTIKKEIDVNTLYSSAQLLVPVEVSLSNNGMCLAIAYGVNNKASHITSFLRSGSTWSNTPTAIPITVDEEGITSMRVGQPSDTIFRIIYGLPNRNTVKVKNISTLGSIINTFDITVSGNVTNFGSIIATNYDSSSLAVGANNRVYLYKQASGYVQSDVINTAIGSSYYYIANRVVFSPNGTKLLIADGTKDVAVYHLDSNVDIVGSAALKAESEIETGCFSNNDILYLTGVKGTFEIYSGSPGTGYSFVVEMGTVKRYGRGRAIYLSKDNTSVILVNPDGENQGSGSVECYTT
jgi:hypothetical protein